MGSDCDILAMSSSVYHFNPRSPDGERQFDTTQIARLLDFNPRSPDGERPGHATIPPIRYYFNPRSPDGERHNGTYSTFDDLFISIHAPRMGSDRENGHLRPRYGQNHPFSTLIVSQIVVDVLGTVRKSQKHQRTSHYEVIKQPERQK